MNISHLPPILIDVQNYLIKSKIELSRNHSDGRVNSSHHEDIIPYYSYLIYENGMILHLCIKRMDGYRSI